MRNKSTNHVQRKLLHPSQNKYLKIRSPLFFTIFDPIVTDQEAGSVSN